MRRARVFSLAFAPNAASVVVVASLSATAGCEGSNPSTATAEVLPERAGSTAPPDAQAPTPVDPGVQPDGEVVSAVHWFHGTFDDALAEAKRTNKRVLVDIGAYWCPPCHRLDEELFVQPDVGEFVAERFVALHVDAERDEGPELVERYHVQAYPTLLVLEPSGVERGRIVDFVAARPFRDAITRIEAGETVLAELHRAVDADANDLEAAYALGHALALAARREPAEALFERVLAGDPDDAAGLASKVLYDRAGFFVAKLDADPDAAIVAYRDLQTRYPKSKSALRAYRRIGRQLAKQGKHDEAIASLDAMLATNPGSTDLRSSYGWFSFRQNCRPARGLEVVREGIVAAPEDADLRYLEAELAARAGDPVAAASAIRKASELEPKRAYYRRSIARFEAAAEAAG